MSVRREWWRRECMDVKGCWGESLLLSLPLSSCGAVLALLFLSRPGAGSELSCKPMWFMVWLSLPAGLHFSTHSKGMCSLNFLSSLLFLPTYCRSLLNQLERFNMALVLSAMWPVPASSKNKIIKSYMKASCHYWLLYWCSTVGSAKFTQLAWPRDLPRNYEDSWKRAVPLREIFQLSLLYSTVPCYPTMRFYCVFSPLNTSVYGYLYNGAVTGHCY